MGDDIVDSRYELKKYDEQTSSPSETRSLIVPVSQIKKLRFIELAQFGV
jgi:hypothetical protein